MTFDPTEIWGTPYGAPLVPRLPIRMRQTDILTVVYRTDPAAADALIPDPLRLQGDLVVVHVYSMRDADHFGVYCESAVQLPVVMPDGRPAVYSPFLVLASAGAVAAGRELYGQPKKDGEVSLEPRGDGLQVRRGPMDGSGVGVAVDLVQEDAVRVLGVDRDVEPEAALVWVLPTTILTGSSIWWIPTGRRSSLPSPYEAHRVCRSARLFRNPRRGALRLLEQHAHHDVGRRHRRGNVDEPVGRQLRSKGLPARSRGDRSGEAGLPGRRRRAVLDHVQGRVCVHYAQAHVWGRWQARHGRCPRGSQVLREGARGLQPMRRIDRRRKRRRRRRRGGLQGARELLREASVSDGPEVLGHRPRGR